MGISGVGSGLLSSLSETDPELGEDVVLEPVLGICLEPRDNIVCLTSIPGFLHLVQGLSLELFKRLYLLMG